MMSWNKKREVRLRYDAEADGYDELYTDEQRMKYELALRRIAYAGADRILDCGCGTGVFLEKVVGSVQFAVGVDLSPKMLERAKLRLGQIPNVDLVCADIDSLPFSEATFGQVFMFTVLPSDTDWDNAISEAMRVLRTDGIMTLSILKKETSSKEVLRKIRTNRLEQRELLNEDTTLDYVVVGKKARKSVRKAG